MNKKQTWFTKALLQSCKTKQVLYYDLLKCKCSENRYIQYRNKLTKLLKIAKRNYVTNVANEHKRDSKSMRKLVKSFIGRKTNCLSNSLLLSPDEFNNYFAESGYNAVKHKQ